MPQSLAHNPLPQQSTAEPAGHSRAAVLGHQFDLVIALLALPVFLIASLPLLGWLTGAGAWVAQKGLQAYLTRRAQASRDPRTVVGMMAGGMLARGWLVAGAILAVGLSDNSAGLAAAVLAMVLFTTYFMIGMFTRPLGPGRRVEP